MNRRRFLAALGLVPAATLLPDVRRAPWWERVKEKAASVLTRVPLNGDADIVARLARHSAGYCEDRDCFVALEEVPPVMFEFDGKLTVRRGSVVITGPVAPRDGRFCVSPRLAELMGMARG